MNILVNQMSKINVQGFAENKGIFHSNQMTKCGNLIRGGISSGKRKAMYLGLPVFITIKNAIK